MCTKWQGMVLKFLDDIVHIYGDVPDCYQYIMYLYE